MKKVTAIGGIFFKCKDPEGTKKWYAEHLGLPTNDYGATFEWSQSDDPEKKGMTIWSPFEESTNYFGPSQQEYMINYMVEDLEGLVEQLKKEGVTLVDELVDTEYGKFVHILDPNGIKIELWEAKD